MAVYLIGSGAGFSGDRTDAPQSVVTHILRAGAPGAIVFETIGERTLALGHVARRENPDHGYEPLLAEMLEPVIGDCLRGGVAIVGNFGVANPDAAARRLAAMAREAGFSDARIAVVRGDDIAEGLDLSQLEIWEGDRGLAADATEVIAANVYIGARPIAEALQAGAQIVVTGRVADPALVLGPLVAHYRWRWDDWRRLAQGTLAGHLLECGSQVSGGYFADPGFKDVPSPATIGFPIAEVDADGGFTVTKAPGTGGVIDLRTVKEQILYEMHDPAAYLTPDVVLDITGVSLMREGPNRVRVEGAQGRPAPATLKATVSFPGDWLGEGEISYAGPNALARARLAAETTAERLRLRGLGLRTRFDLIGAVSVFDGDGGALSAAFADAEPQDVRMRLAVSGANRSDVEAALREVVALYCCGPAGGGGVRTRTQNRIRTVSYLIPRDRVRPRFEMLQEALA